MVSTSFLLPPAHFKNGEIFVVGKLVMYLTYKNSIQAGMVSNGTGDVALAADHISAIVAQP